ncbi:glycosyltransferase (GT2) [Formosa agariphila KMM 3901]|uniref:Glycosyltransferase (GT2) n=1 Tax=Formosa agariphila (strain DSM 15362 / KCTC 12365 / LMG 23005 / KMM 3901 / M-2Alg 35-1) TaxID=1347342 RepID=T2KNI9_FORAG|nr:glycosyltransferase family 2 protein [Formosa agariphila]CDF80033.1 glycosyltransferase (GT2) [Formosa agariphila KMM 3901]
MPTTPLVSIIIPTYNRAHLIGETLDSVLAQTYQNWECIVVDDGSTDGTDQLMEEYCTKDSRFQYHLRPADRLAGGNGARNYGFEVSKGDYVQWFDSDDLFVVDAIKIKVEAICLNGEVYDYALCGFETFGGEDYYLRTYNLDTLENITHFFLEEGIVLNTPCIMYSRKIIKDITFNESLTRTQDLDFVFRVLKQNGLKGVNIDKVLLRTRMHRQTITHKFKESANKDVVSELSVWKQIYSYLLKESDKKNSNIALEKCLKNIKKLLLNKEVSLFFKELNSLESLNFLLKLKLNGVGFTYYFFNKGGAFYNREMNSYFKNNV